jgi:AcrR family transcriptional regulator
MISGTVSVKGYTGRKRKNVFGGTPMKRGKYELKRRAERQQETRRRITEAAIELHSTVGGTQATISEIAERAGVQRRTVYNHFPTEHALLSACMGHYWASNPWPDPTLWEEIADPEERLRRALGEVYAFYGRHERLLANFAADAQVNPTVREVGEPYYLHWERMRDILAAGWKAIDGQRNLLVAALDLALDFQTWSTLVGRRREGIGDEEAVELMVEMVRCAVRGD